MGSADQSPGEYRLNLFKSDQSKTYRVVDLAIAMVRNDFGYYGSITQALSRMQPAWKANMLAILVLPLFQHLIEFAIHYFRGTPRLAISIGVSFGFTIISTLFNLYSMRRGSLIVGAEARSLWHDVNSFPRLFWGFVSSGPRLILSR